ncbi:hypothetical protein FB45DRAFT_744966 [Roridomyces roridus]|uniref:ER transporter 6TM N-terminal domain-containing protein n=1 Tax=Roridomyces roridus TaxID=1738132 RepID=A0AAD7BWV7_9AGAR|nr:hypothetical protein FB45DRAFT_744966 [Roridomyces roridus]
MSGALPTTSRPAALRLRIETSEKSPGGSSSISPRSHSATPWFNKGWPSSLQWIPANFTWAKIKPTLRAAIAAWLSTILFLVPRVEVSALGSAAFLILMTSFMSPPNDPFMGVLERELTILLFVTATWGWSCLGIRLADLARVNRDPTVTLVDAVTGRYLEAAPTVIIGVFIFLGTVVISAIRARAVPSQIFACVLSCICLDILLTTAVLFPYPFYLACAVGRSIVVPISMHSAISLVCSVFIFPSTISSQFTTQLTLVLASLTKSFELHQSILKLDPYSAAFASMVSTNAASVAKSEASLAPLAASARLLKGDLVYSRFAPTDLIALQDVAKRMAVRAHGMTLYYQIIEPGRERFPVSTPATPAPASPVPSRPPSPVREHRDSVAEDSLPTTPTRKSRHSYFHNHHNHHNLLHNSLLHLSRKKHQNPVGVFESQRYLDLEAHLHHPDTEAHTKEIVGLLAESCTPLLKACQDSLIWTQDWLGYVRQGWISQLLAGAKERRALKQRMKELSFVRANLKKTLESFKEDKRHLVLEPWRSSFDLEHETEHEAWPHRHLFHCYVYQYHLMQVSTNLLTMLDSIHTLEEKHKDKQLWTPKFFNWSSSSEFVDDEEDPETIQGVPPAVDELDLGATGQRDPDALPPRNRLEWAMRKVYIAFSSLSSGNTLFAIKAALLTVILCLPSFLKSSATFAYENRFVWGIIMGQVTLSRFRGDTVFGLSSRVLSTFFGGLLGMVLWYMSAGSGSGSPYGLAAVCAVCFPLFFYGRLYWPGPPMRVIIFFVTTCLVIGYSYQDQNIKSPGNPGFGWEVAWRRFILVTAGVVAAGIFSLLPPSTTIRRYERTIMARTASEIGTMYCDIISYANSRREMDTKDIVTGLIAIRSKILRSMALKNNATYEFSLKGRWPAKRYQKTMELQLGLAYSLSHLMSTVEHMEPAWTRAFLRRTRFLDSDFQGEVLAVISMISTALRTGTALPQITPCPLLDRFANTHWEYGLNVIHKESEEDYGLPRELSLETLQNEQYLMFCVAVSSAYNIMSRLDRLMMTVKEIVGEQYHIHGAGIAIGTRRTGVPMGSRTTTMQYRPPQTV